MARLLDALEHTGSASAIWNEYAIVVIPATWEDDAGAQHEGWLLRAQDYLAEDEQDRGKDGSPNGSQRVSRSMVVNDHRLQSWDDLADVLAELGVPDEYEGWW